MSGIPILPSSGVDFPPVHLALGRPNGLLAVGGNLEPDTLLRAYSRGIFPWFNRGDPILWWHPEPRMVLRPQEVRVSRSMRRVLASGRFSFGVDGRFGEVVRKCASVPRKGEEVSSWITDDLGEAYVRLHELGHAHSVETLRGGKLVGGLYGVSLGGCFFGESMFHEESNASKAALAVLCDMLSKSGHTLLDCQVSSAHLASMGGREISRPEFMRRLRSALSAPTDPLVWHNSGLATGAGDGPREEEEAG